MAGTNLWNLGSSYGLVKHIPTPGPEMEGKMTAGQHKRAGSYYFLYWEYS